MIHAVAGVEADVAPAPSTSGQGPAVQSFPAVAVSRMLEGNRSFVEQHRCAARLLGLGRGPMGRGACAAGLA